MVNEDRAVKLLSAAESIIGLKSTITVRKCFQAKLYFL